MDQIHIKLNTSDVFELKLPLIFSQYDNMPPYIRIPGNTLEN